MTKHIIEIDTDGIYCGECCPNRILVDKARCSKFSNFEISYILNPASEGRWKRCQDCLDSEIKETGK